MAHVVYGTASAWLSELFFVEKGKAYDADDPPVAEVMRRHPWAFSDAPMNPVEAATAAPGERRGRGGRG
jgi:hypothetical protein